MLAAGIDEAYIRPRGRVPVGTVPLTNTRWRDRLERGVTTIALEFESELRDVAGRATRMGWPVVEGAVAGRPFPIGSLRGLRVGWLSWYEDGLEIVAPDWSLRPDGRLVAQDGRAVETVELVANLARISICDDRGPAEVRRRYYDAELAQARANAVNSLAYLDRQLAHSRPPRPVIPPSR